MPARIDETLIEGIDSIQLMTINKIVCDIEQNRFTIPILIRKYLQVGARVLGFNTDHAFCDGLDALILVDLAQVPEKTILMLSKEMTDIDVIGRFSRYGPTIPESSCRAYDSCIIFRPLEKFKFDHGTAEYRIMPDKRSAPNIRLAY